MAEELLHARAYAAEDERSQAIAIWNARYNYQRAEGPRQAHPADTWSGARRRGRLQAGAS